MSDVLLYGVLGLSAGAVYGLFAVGIVVVHRGTGVVSLAQGSIGTIGGYVFLFGRDDQRWPTGIAILLSLAFSCLLGLVISVAMAFLRHAPQLALMVASLGVLLTLEAAAVLIWGTSVRTTSPLFPQDSVSFLGVDVGADRLLLTASAIALTVILVLVDRFTRLGTIAAAVTESSDQAALLGLSPVRVGAVSWALGAALAALAGILILPLASLTASGYTLFVVPALGAALVARFRSIGVAATTGIAIGVAQGILTGFVDIPGAEDAVPFLVIVLAVAVGGRRIPDRFHLITSRPPAVTSGRFAAAPALIATAAFLALLFTSDRSVQTALTSTAITCLLMLSLVVLTGYLGQISLAQVAFAGFSGFTVASLSATLPMPVALVLGALAAVPVGMLTGIPALYVRGVNLAIVTLGLAVAMQRLVFGNETFGGGDFGKRVAVPGVFGLDVDSVLYPARFGVLTLVVVWLAALAVARLRRSGLGHRMLAVRFNERAAAAAGIGVVRTKLIGFGVSAFLAGLAGGLIAYQAGALSAERFGILASLPLLAYSYIGGVGSIAGAVVAAMLAPGSLVATVVDRWTGAGEWIPLVGGLALLQMVAMNPDGIAPLTMRSFRRWRPRPRSRPRPGSHPTPPPDRGTVSVTSDAGAAVIDRDAQAPAQPSPAPRDSRKRSLS